MWSNSIKVIKMYLKKLNIETIVRVISEIQYWLGQYDTTE